MVWGRWCGWNEGRQSQSLKAQVKVYTSVNGRPEGRGPEWELVLASHVVPQPFTEAGSPSLTALTPQACCFPGSFILEKQDKFRGEPLLKENCQQSLTNYVKAWTRPRLGPHCVTMGGVLPNQDTSVSQHLGIP